MRFSAAFTAMLPLQKLVADLLPRRQEAAHPAPPLKAPAAPTSPLTPPAQNGETEQPERAPEDLDQRVREVGEW